MSTVLCVGLFVMACQFPDAPKPTAVVCPPLVAWSVPDQKAAALELGKLPPGHPLRKMGVVAVKQRAVVRACRMNQ